jgi:hypothetical protein
VENGESDRRSSRGASCAECGAPFEGDQRYCLNCGARRSAALPPAVAVLLATFRDRGRGKGAVAAPAPAAKAAGSAATVAGDKGLLAWIPSPRGAAALVVCMLALGTIVGTATSQIARSAGVETIIVDIAEKKVPPPPEEEPIEEEVEVPEVAAPSVAPAPLPEEALPEVLEEPLPEEQQPEEPTEPLPEEPLPEEEFNPEETEELPEVKHLFVIMLGENGFEETFGATSAAPYLAQTLPEQGELLSNYFAVTTSRLANQVALLSGQGPTPETLTECAPTETMPLPTDIVPGTISPEGQVEGTGCLYPKEVETLPAQLEKAKLKWKAYLQEAVPGTPEPNSCRLPFAAFHSLADGPECAKASAPSSQLAKDLKSAKKTPAFSYIVPNACSAGSVLPCASEAPVSPAAAEPFLEEVVPEIVKSPAYKEGGLLVITSAQAPQVAPAVPDTSSCCATPAYPNLPPLAEEPATGPVKATGGGGRVGLLLLSSFVAPGTVNEETYANHFTLLLTIEELFGLEKLGYAENPALLPFDSSVFNAAAVAAEEEESTSTSEEEETKRKRALDGLRRALG